MNRKSHIIVLTGLLTISAIYSLQARDEITVVEKPLSSQRNSYYISSRAPLLPAPFVKLPIGAIKPEGWLRKQLELQSKGFSAYLTDISRFCRKEGNAWLDKDHSGHGFWEEVPYWLKGFGDLGYILNHKRIKKETQEWIEAVLGSQRKDGWFGPLDNLKSSRTKTSRDGEKVKGRPDMWPNALMLSVLRSYYEHTGDKRVINHMQKYFDWLIHLPENDYLIHWVARRRGIELLKNILWLYNVIGDKRLLELAHKTHRRSNDWTSGISRYHCVDMSECFYEPAFYYTLSKEKNHFAAAERNFRTLYDEFGQVPGGMFGGDEQSREGYTGPRQAIETCAMVEMMNSCEMMFTHVDGDMKWADRCEDVAFNSYPAALTADMKALRYLTAPNHIVSDRLNKKPDICNGGAMYVMNPHAHRCCQHNHAHGWPYYSEYLWLATPDNGLCAMLYTASTVTAAVGEDRKISIREETEYPFSEKINFKIKADSPVEFPLYLRIPGWCKNAIVNINEQEIKTSTQPGRYLRIKRTWKNNDSITLSLPMKISIRKWEKNKNSISVDYGPLTFSLKIGERYVASHGNETIKKQFINDKIKDKDWAAFEIFPTTPWNYGLIPGKNFEITKRKWPQNDMVWTHEGAPVSITAKAKRIPEWKLKSNNIIGEISQSPVLSKEPTETVTLLPMGACRLRLSAFPVIGDGPNAKPWKKEATDSRLSYTTEEGVEITASYVGKNDSLKALNDGKIPKSSNDRKIPRMTFWPNKGKREIINIKFKKERTINGIEVYWYDDTGGGQCRVPVSAKLFWYDNSHWNPCRSTLQIGTIKDQMNRLKIEPVKTTGLELRIQLQKKYSAGILEMRVF